MANSARLYKYRRAVIHTDASGENQAVSMTPWHIRRNAANLEPVEALRYE